MPLPLREKTRDNASTHTREFSVHGGAGTMTHEGGRRLNTKESAMRSITWHSGSTRVIRLQAAEEAAEAYVQLVGRRQE